MKVHNIINTIPPGSNKLDATLTDEIELEEELKEGLIEFTNHCNVLILNTFPNFQFGWLLGPAGYTASVNLNDPFTSDMFRCDRYRVIVAAKLKMSSTEWGKDLSKEIENVLCKFLPTVCHFPPLEHEDKTSGWSPSLNKRHTSIGLYSATINVDGNVDTEYYLVCHNSLPDEYLHLLQQKDEEIDEMNQTILNSTDPSNLPSHIQGIYTYESQFKPGESLNERALEISKENAIRLIDLCSELIDIPLVATIYDKNTEYKYDEEIDVGKTTLLEKALQWWEAGTPIYPFTTLPSAQHNEGVEWTIPKELYAYPIGSILASLYKSNETKFRLYENKFQIIFRMHTRTFTPDFITDYNTYRITRNGKLCWFSNTTSTLDNDGVLVYEGLEPGYKCYNYKSQKRKQKDWKNNYLNGVPVLFPFKQGKQEVKDDSVIKNFTLERGGFKAPRSIPEQFNGKFVNVEQFEREIHHLGSPETCLQLNPLKTFLSADTFDIPRFTN